jgi:hypothetical protein
LVAIPSVKRSIIFSTVLLVEKSHKAFCKACKYMYLVHVSSPLKSNCFVLILFTLPALLICANFAHEKKPPYKEMAVFLCSMDKKEESDITHGSKQLQQLFIVCLLFVFNKRSIAAFSKICC